MSQENVEIVRANFEAWNSGDMDALRERFDRDVIMRMPEDWPEPGPHVGREAVMRQLGQQRETWDADDFQLISDFIDVGDRVAVRFIWVGAGYGPQANVEATGVYTVRRGKVFAIEHFWDHAEALETLGLSEQAMSQENVDLARRAVDAFNRRDLDAFLSLMDDDIEIVSRIVAIEGGLHGHEGARRWWQNWLDVWPDYQVEILDVRDLGDVTLTALRALAHGAGSQAPFEDTAWQLGRWRSGKCVLWQVFTSREEALEAVGPSEQDAHAGS